MDTRVYKGFRHLYIDLSCRWFVACLQTQTQTQVDNTDLDDQGTGPTGTQDLYADTQDGVDLDDPGAVDGEGLEGMDDGLAGELGGLAFDDGDEIDEEAGFTDFKLPDHACR